MKDLAKHKANGQKEGDMVYSFLYDFKKYSVEERKERLQDLTEEQLMILEHIYLNKQMFSNEELRDYIPGFEPSATDVRLEDLISLLKADYDIDIAAQMILNYLYTVGLVDGDAEASKAAKVIFCKRRIVGVKAKDIIAERERRNLKKNN